MLQMLGIHYFVLVLATISGPSKVLGGRGRGFWFGIVEMGFGLDKVVLNVDREISKLRFFFKAIT